MGSEMCIRDRSEDNGEELISSIDNLEEVQDIRDLIDLVTG